MTHSNIIYKKVVDQVECCSLADDWGKVSSSLLDVIHYGFEIEDFYSLVTLLKKRKQLVDYRMGYDCNLSPGYHGGFDSRKYYKKFIKMIAYECDDIVAQKYLQELSCGKFFKMYHSTEKGGWAIESQDILNTYQFCKKEKEENCME